MQANSTYCDASGLELKPRKSDHSGKLELVPRAPANASQQRNPHNLMTWTPTAGRADVIRMVGKYVELEFSIRSTAGKLVIDEGRLARKRGIDIDVSSASATEILDAVKTADIRRAVYAPPEARGDVRLASGEIMRAVAPRRDVATVVKVRATRTSGDSSSDARNWRGTVAQKLGQLHRCEEAALVDAAKIRMALMLIRNRLAAARSDVGRLRSGGKQARNLRKLAETRVAELKSQESSDSDRLKSLVRSGDYRSAVDRLLSICTKSREVELYCFPWIA